MPLDANKLQFFADFIKKETGIVYTDTNAYQLESRLKQIVQMLDLKDEEELYSKCQYGIVGQVKELILDLATNNETTFFRDTALFKALQSEIIPGLKDSTGPLKIWSAASSTGQEIYSIAMIIDQIQKENPTFPKVELHATDISKRVLGQAEEGVYSQLQVQRGLPAKLLVTYFEKEGETSWRLKEALRKQVKFKHLNLLDSWYGIENCDIILCRNVLIYQDVENKRAVVARMTSALKPNGLLIFGAAESMLGVSEDFIQEKIAGAVVYRKKDTVSKAS